MKLNRPVKMLLLLLAACLLLAGCAKKDAGGARLFLDDKPWGGGDIAGGNDLRVIVALNGREIAVLPFNEAHRLRVEQPDVGENTLVLTGEAAYMESADCDNQDCVGMGEITRENLETRVMGGFIVCLPHRLSVEVRGD